MQKRKIFLLSACAVLLLVCILQAVLLNRSSVKVFSIKDDFDALSIESNGRELKISKKGENWVLGKSEYPASEQALDPLLSALDSIKVLDKVGNVSSESSRLRYDFTDSKKITVKAFLKGKELRTLTVGKASATGTQSYVTVDGGNDVYLASGNLRETFSKTEDDLRSKIVWSIEKDTIASVSISKTDGTDWKLFRTGQSENIEWTLDGHGIVTGEVDPQKAEDFFGEFASLSASSWYEDSALPQGKYLLTCEVEAGDKKLALGLFEIKAESDGEVGEYCASSTESPYTFEISNYSARKFLKSAEEFLK